MEEENVIRPSPLRPGGGSKSSPRGSPSFRSFNSGRTVRREGRSGLFSSRFFRNNRIVLWLLVITLWAYAGFYFQSKWAHGDNKEDLFSGGYGGESTGENPEPQAKNRRDLIGVDIGAHGLQSVVKQSGLKNINMTVGHRKNGSSKLSKKKTRKSRHSSRRIRAKPKVVVEDVETEVDDLEEEIPMQNTTYGFLAGPFGSVEDSILEWSPEKRSGTCDRKGAFARLVWSRKFVLIFHELSMTRAPLAMMELATEFLSCGATIRVIVLNKKGGLMPELSRRKIKVIDHRPDLSFKTAMRADLIIAGSAVSSSWIEQYFSRTTLGSTQILWWIMENKREYFDRSKLLLNRVKKLIFLSESQSKQWLEWCEAENIKIKSDLALLPLSVNDELAFVAGIPCSLNTPSFTTESMLEKRKSLRSAVRTEMGLTDDDMLAISLSSIHPGKGQLLLLGSASLLIERRPLHLNESFLLDQDYHSRALLQNPGKDTRLRRIMKGKLLSGRARKKEQKLKILIGSVGSKSNKLPYVKALLEYLSVHSNLSKSVLWTPETTRVASLYAAADVYVMNSQGPGETFGRVTIEAMAFGLPVLGTEAGGTKEIVEHNMTGLLHPLGLPGAQILAKNLKFFARNPLARQEIGRRAREKVEKMYLKKHMYQKFGEILYKSMRIK